MFELEKRSYYAFALKDTLAPEHSLSAFVVVTIAGRVCRLLEGMLETLPGPRRMLESGTDKR